MLNSVTHRSLLVRGIVAFLSLVAAVVLVAAPAFAKTAFADGYTLNLSASEESLAVGDSFTVSEILSKEDGSPFTMYAVTTYVTYDPNVLSLDSSQACDLGVVSTRSNTIVFNALSPVLAGRVWDSGKELCSLSFTVVGEGSTTLGVSRAVVSNNTGMRTYPVSAAGLSVNIGSTGDDAIAPTDPAGEEGSTSGTATNEDSGADSPSSFVENVKKDPLVAFDVTVGFTPDDYKQLVDAGFTDVDLVDLGFTQQEISSVKEGKTVNPAIGEELRKTIQNAAETDLAGNKQSEKPAGKGFPIIPVVACVVVIAGLVAILVLRRRVTQNN